MDDTKKIRKHIKELYNILEEKPNTKKIICKVSIFAVIISFLKFCITKMLLIFA
tara:strand:+ start:771 stop:932 length:162 start_codon:yes stop_codon:yes gene_type:complete